MMENCEAANEKIRQNFSTTLNELNTTGLTSQQVDWLKGNMTSNFTSGLLKCDLKEFLTDVSVYILLNYEIEGSKLNLPLESRMLDFVIRLPCQEIIIFHKINTTLLVESGIH